MNVSMPLSDEARRFLIDQARQLKQTNQPATLETTTAHSVVTGKVLDVYDGGLVFQQSDTNYHICVPWESVAGLIGIPTMARGEQAFAAGAGQQRY
jgi:hypothetical protein